MAKKQENVPRYGTTMRRGIQYYRTRITDAAESRETSYSPDLPPKITPIRFFLSSNALPPRFDSCLHVFTVFTSFLSMVFCLCCLIAFADHFFISARIRSRCALSK